MKQLFTLISLMISSAFCGFSQPVNDNCAGAISLTAGISCTFSTYSNVGATTTTTPTTPAAPGCGNYLGGDVWFKVTVPASGHLIFDTQTPTGGLTDIAMAIYAGDCSTGLTLLECDDDDSDNGYYMPKIDRIGLNPGTTVYIRVWEYGNNSFGNFDICVSEPLGEGPCATVQTILCGETQTLNFQNGGAWNSQFCGNSAPGQEAIFAYTPTQNTGTFLTLSGNPSAEWINFAYNTTCSSTGWTCIGRTLVNSATFGPLALDSGVTYYFIVDNEDASNNVTSVSFFINCPEIPGYYEHPSDGIHGTYNGACMVNTCSGTYVDDGNTNDYSNNINSIYRTFCPELPGKCMTATFTMMNIDYTVLPGDDSYDLLYVRNGPTQGSPILWYGCGTLASPINGPFTFPASNTFTSTDQSGCLTFAFESDGDYSKPGWVIQLSCTDCSITQTNNDCNTATPICGATNLNSASPGPGLTSTCGGCNLSENYSNWYYFEITADGKLALDAKPEDFFEDYDFALYEADTCASLGDPVRCSYAMAPTYCRDTWNWFYQYRKVTGVWGWYACPGSGYISNVTFSTIDNTTTDGGWSFYTSPSPTVNSGSTYALNVTVAGGLGNNYCRAYFDWNKDLDFTDAGEEYILCTNAADGVKTLNITIPPTARLGKTGFRIMNRYGVVPTACPVIDDPDCLWGEVEDYSIFISDGTHCSNNIKDMDESGADCGGVDCVPCSETYWPTNTGMDGVATDYSEDVMGDSWVNWVSVTAGQRYYIMINNWSPGANGFDLVWQFSEGGAMDCDIVPLPVELLSFTASCNDGIVDLAWDVASEINNDYFTVLKSYNGITFNTVNTINGRGNANSLKTYETSYREENPGTVYYKLKQVDFDGTISYSNMITSFCENDNRTFTAVPNPVHQGEEWRVTGMVEDDLMEIFDVYGREHLRENLAAGVYYIRINGKLATKLIVY